jgi:parallel beta-helix repeat protein
MWVHDVTGLGATVQFNDAVGTGCVLHGIDHDITLRNIVVERGIGEALYIAGNYNIVDDGGCVTGPLSGDNHYDILIENNTTIDSGINGEEGEGIDVKAGIYNVTIRGNNFTFTHNGPAGTCGGAAGIDTLGQMPNSTHDSNYLIENNIFHDIGCGIALGATHMGIVRNNVIYNSSGGGIVVWTRLSGTTPNNQRIRIYSNTIYNSGGIAFSDFDDAPVVRNNLLVNNPVSIDGDPPGIDSDYNLLSPTGSRLPEGDHSIVLRNTTGILANPDGGDFHLMPGSPAIGTGADLDATGFATDIGGTQRPQGAGWDIGAYEFTTTLPKKRGGQVTSQ